MPVMHLEPCVLQGPSQDYELNYATAALGNVLPIYLLLIYSIQIRVMLTRVLEDKEKKIKEGMKMSGLSDSELWLSWFITSLLKMGVVCVAIVVVVKVGKLFQHSDGVLLFVFFFLFTLVSITFSFMVSTVFSKARTGGVVGMLLWIALSTPAYGLASSSVSAAAQTFGCLLAPLAFNFGASILNSAENGAVGVTWDNVGSVVTASGINVPLSTVLGMLVLDLALYAVITWYLSHVAPNEFGTTLKPWFCCTRSYWRGGRGGADNSEHAPLLDESAGDDVVATEAVAADVAGRDRVEIRNLTKVYATKDGPKTAVKNLSLSMYEGHITALLAHNGGGKSTTISMLTGLFPPTAGDALVYGASIVDDMATVREHIGVCPQHDTVRGGTPAWDQDCM